MDARASPRGVCREPATGQRQAPTLSISHAKAVLYRRRVRGYRNGAAVAQPGSSQISDIPSRAGQAVVSESSFLDMFKQPWFA